jgi:hypothetical protein
VRFIEENISSRTSILFGKKKMPFLEDRSYEVSDITEIFGPNIDNLPNNWKAGTETTFPIFDKKLYCNACQALSTTTEEAVKDQTALKTALKIRTQSRFYNSQESFELF